MSLEVYNGICDQLPRAVEGCLPAAKGFLEFCTGGCEVCFLRGCDGANFAAAAGVNWVELRGDDRGWEGCDCCWRSFVGEKVGCESGL
jgi:hypothetical protein